MGNTPGNSVPIQAVSDPPLRSLIPSKGNLYNFHTMVKASGSQCNLDCSYCFYAHKGHLMQQAAMPRMSGAVLEAHIRQYIAAQTGPEVVFSWQGGEPTLMGLSFFNRVVELQDHYRKPNQHIANDLQTNGILLDEEWCKFLKKSNFLVGLSIDGPAELHDVYRRSKGGEPTFKKVMHSVELLHQFAVPFTVLCVVNRRNARKPIDSYRFFRDEVHPRMIQLIPAVEPADFRTVAPRYWSLDKLPTLDSDQAKPSTPGAMVTEWSVDPDDWGYFLNRIWDEWLAKDFGKVFVDQFENVISQMFGYGAQKCTSAQICGKGLALEHNGDLYSCDHFVYPEYRLGNICEVHEGDLAFSERQKQFALAKSDELPAYCKSCSYLALCWGECPKNRFIKTPSGDLGLNYLCSGLRKFYAKVTLSERELANRLKARGISAGQNART